MRVSRISERWPQPLRLAWRRVLTTAGLVFTASALRAQDAAVGGIVIDARSLRPLDGVQIGVEGTTLGAVSDGAGRFRIANVTGTDVSLVFRRIGYKPHTERVRAGSTDLRVALQDAPAVLNEVVVTGTAEPVEKRAIGNTVTKIAAAQIQEIAPAQNMTSLVNGRAPGVVLIAGSGAVGAGPRMRIRGANSFSLSDQPLIYIDGIRIANDVSTGPQSQFFSSGVISRLNDLDPDDIESIEIVKGPAAATLYGTEANNGVLQIITRRGREGRASFAATVRQGVNWFMDAENRIGLTYNRDPATQALRPWNPVAFYKQQTGRELFKNGIIQNYNMAVNGGTSQIRYNVSGSYDNEKGIEPTNSLWRYAANANITIAARSNFDIQANINANQQRVDVPQEAGGGMWFSAYFGQFPRDSLERLRMGFFSAPPDAYWGAFDWWQRVNRLTASIQATHRMGTWLTHRVIVGNDLTAEDNNNLTQRMGPYFRQFFTNPTDQNGTKQSQYRDLNVTSLDYAATAKYQISNNVGTNTSFGAQFFRRNTYIVLARGEGFPAIGLTQVDAAATTFGGETFRSNSTLGFYGQETVELWNRLFVTGALRVDDNSAFGNNFSWVKYPKVAAAYTITDEPWWRLGWVNALKLRAAYGETGQQPVTFSALRTYSAVTGGDGTSAVTPNTVGNDDLRAERARELELGFESSGFNERVGLEFTYYSRKTEDAIVSQNVAPSSGFPSQQFVNIGAIKGSGIEAIARANVLNSDKVNLELTLSYSHNRNEVTKLNPGVQFLGTSNIRHQIGYPVGAFWDRRVVSAEFNPNGTTRNTMCDDGNGGTTPCLDAAGNVIAPRVYIGRGDAPDEGALSATATFFRRLRLYAMVDSKRGHRQFDNNLRARCSVFRLCLENLDPLKYSPRVIAEFDSPNLLRDIYYGHAGYTKLRELSASYTIPERFVRRFGGAAATFTVSGRNLHTWTKWSGVDPESFFTTEQFARTEQAQTPPLAVFLTSFNITF
jgi:TonB-linked SusC/RagA family outer membrane protein